MSWDSLLREAKKDGNIKINFGGNNMNDIDWTKASEGTTHYWAASGGWYKLENGSLHIYSTADSKWAGSFYDEESFLEEGGVLSRPVENKKVKYEKVEDLPNGWFVRWADIKGDRPESYYVKGQGYCTVVKGNSTGLEVGFDCFTRLDYLSYSPTLDGKYLTFIQQSPEWKIKHIKSDSYKCGRDAALTILYKDIGDGYYEYKYAICNPKDMFSRKKGVEVALSKPDTWKVYVGNYKDKGVLQVIVWHLPFTGNLSKEVINLLLDEDFYAS